jgi:hypothetical protein
MIREEGAAGLVFVQTSALRRDLLVPPAQKNTSRSGAAATLSIWTEFLATARIDSTIMGGDCLISPTWAE